jgi:acyl-CoA thioesterase-2
MDEAPAPHYLLDLMDLERIDRDIFRGLNGGEGGGRLFGGQVAAQALRAAGGTVEADHHANSLHAYFLRPGRYGVPITFVVDRLRDGSSFTTRRVVAQQNGEAILGLDASFHQREPGDEYQPSSIVALADPPGDQPPPPPGGPPGPRPHRGSFEMRQTTVTTTPEPDRAVWVRATEHLPDEPDLHACIVTFLSDMGPVGAVRRQLGGWTPGRGMTASLDHCVWFHRPARADAWLLYRLDAVAAAGARGVAKGELWTEDGHLAATIMQEALVRPPKAP